jgi:hypothetical protein
MFDPAGIAKREILHGAGEGDFTNLNDQMQMVDHQTEGMDSVAEDNVKYFSLFS